MLRSTVASLVAAANALAPFSCNSGKTSAVDAGNPLVDAGSPPCDSGRAAPADAGSRLADAGSSGPRVVVTLAINGGINGMTTDGTNVFWAGDYDAGLDILMVPVDGGAVTVIATVPQGDAVGGIANAVALGATNVYWTVPYDFSIDGGFQTDILRTPRGGGPTTVLLSGTQVTTGLAVDESSIYWGDLGPAGQSVV
jgi:hypothetical protein